MDTLSSTFAILPSAATAMHKIGCAAFRRSIQLATKTAQLTGFSPSIQTTCTWVPKAQVAHVTAPLPTCYVSLLFMVVRVPVDVLGFASSRKVAYGTLSPLGGGGLVLQRTSKWWWKPSTYRCNKWRTGDGLCFFNNHLGKWGRVSWKLSCSSRYPTLNSPWLAPFFVSRVILLYSGHAQRQQTR